MVFPKVLACTCGCSPKFLRRISITRDLSSTDCITAVEYSVECPICRGFSPWVEKSQGGIVIAARLWDDLILDELEAGF